MLAADIRPSRLERAKREVLDLLNRLQGDRIGLVAFAGTAFQQCPLTLDYSGFHIFLEALDPDFLPVGGTALGDAIDVALASFDPKSPAERAVILITDGEPTGADPVIAAERARDAGVRLYVIGVGSVAGAPVPQKGGGFTKDGSGRVVLSRLQEDLLKKVAALSGGAYARSVAGDMDWETLYDGKIRGTLEARTLQSGRLKVWEDRFQWPLGVALGLLVMAIFLPLRTRSSRNVLSLAILFTFFFPGPCYAASVGGTVREGLAAWETGAYEKALESFIRAQVESPESPEIGFNVGNAYYRTGRYDEALESYSAALGQAEGPLRNDVRFNMGNTAYRLGKLEDAVVHYEKILEEDPSDADARRNLEFVRKEMEQRKREPPPESSPGGNEERKDSKTSKPEGGESDKTKSAGQRRDPEKPGTGEAGDPQGQRDETGKQQRAGKEGAEPDETAARAEPGSDDEGMDRRQAAGMLNRLSDRPGRAMLPAYGRRAVEKDW